MEVRKKGKIVELAGSQPKVEDFAPQFSLKNLNNDVKQLSDFSGKPLLISVVPDIDTRICSLQTKRFNQAAAAIEGVQFVTISNNTREEQMNWCAAEGVDMELLHDTDNSFGEAYGLFIPELNQLARAIFVIDSSGKIADIQISSEIAEEPDYDKAIKVAKALI